MDPAAPALVAATVWFVVYLGYVLLAGMGIFWAVVWPEGQAARRLRTVAVAGLALVGLGTLAEMLVTLLVVENLSDTSGMTGSAWRLVRLAVLAVAGFVGAELLRRPVRGGRRLLVLALVVVLTTTLIVESTAAAGSQVAGVAATTSVYLVALAAWLGSLVAVAVLLSARDRPSGLVLEKVWSRFSWLAGVSVLALMVAGTIQHLALGGTLTSRSGVLLTIEAGALALTLLLSRSAVAHGRRLAFRERYLGGLPVAPALAARRPRPGRAIGLQLVLCVALLLVAVAQLAVLPVPGRPVPSPLGEVVPTTAVPSAREGRPAKEEVSRFVPERIALSGASAAVVPVATVSRELVVPEDSGQVGWWDGSSYVGDPYGSTVLAGHVDTVDRGLGYFYLLWNIEVGERVVLSAGDDRRQAYEITTLRQVARTDLVDDDEVFAIDGPPRLVLITCAGEFRADRGGYSRNLMVIARPVP